MSNFTPGPWIARPYSNGMDWGIDAPNGDPILAYKDWTGFATIYGSEDYPNEGAAVAKANARLIAAAPELLEVAKAVDALIEYQYSGSQEAMSALQDAAFKARDAIWKAGAR